MELYISSIISILVAYFCKSVCVCQCRSNKELLTYFYLLNYGRGVGILHPIPQWNCYNFNNY